MLLKKAYHHAKFGPEKGIEQHKIGATLTQFYVSSSRNDRFHVDIILCRFKSKPCSIKKLYSNSST